MAKVVWGVVGERYYEAGADRGVLYLPGVSGVAWNGLTAVNESPSGGDAKPFYFDGFKHVNVAEAEEFEATIEAFSSPLEFAACDGTQSIHNGLFITQQPRVPFGLSYRTKLGNDVDGLEHGYKIHLVYGALAAPASRDNSTIGDSPEPNSYSWDITTTPPLLTGRKPSAHMVVDTRYAKSSDVLELENLLYGTDTTQPDLPTQTAVIAIFA